MSVSNDMLESWANKAGVTLAFHKGRVYYNKAVFANRHRKRLLLWLQRRAKSDNVLDTAINP